MNVIEKVMVVKKEDLHRAGFSDGTGFFTDGGEKIIDAVISGYFFMDRKACETDPSYKQIIPYAVARRGDRYLLTRRLSGQSEKRLHGKLSIGFGGHINESEESDAPTGIILRGLLRELSEEVSIKFSKTPEFVGIINDAGDGVGSVHLGFVYKIEAESDEFTINEPEKMTGRWATADELARLAGGLESWSRLIIGKI